MVYYLMLICLKILEKYLVYIKEKNNLFIYFWLFFLKIPKRLVPAYMDLINAQPNKRLSMSKFLNVCQLKGGFCDNHFFETLLFLDNIQVIDFKLLIF